MKNELLPIGSIVLLRDGKKKLMIYGRKQKVKSNGQIFDYLGCLFPEGYISPAYSFVFNHDQITEVVFRGLVNDEELQFVEQVLNKVTEDLTVKEDVDLNNWK